MQVKTFVEVQGTQVDTDRFLEVLKDMWKNEGNKVKDMKSVQMYYKPDEGNVYYVINGEVTGNFQA